jgi:1-phosphofructokinase family hexose kinase
MILTVTPHSALDKVLFIDRFNPGSVHRTEEVVYSVGGKGLDSSVTLSCLDVETVGLVFVAGSTGEKLIELVQGFGIVPEPVWVDGETRVAHVISETKVGRHSHVISGKILIDQQQLHLFYSRFEDLVIKSKYVICAGSVPPVISPDVYHKITRFAHQNNVPVLIDSSKKMIIEAIPAKPDIIKMNWDEFEVTFSQKAENLEELTRLAGGIYQDHQLNSLVLTCGADGIISFSSEGAFHTIVPKLKAVNAAGAGDAVSSALAWRFSEGDNWKDTMRWAGAVSAAVVLTPGTAECRKKDVVDLLPKIRTIPITL